LKKEILCFYNTPDDEFNFEVLQSVLNGYSVRKTSEVEDAKTLYKNNSYEVVLVDFTRNDGQEFLNFVMANNAEQKIVTMSDNFECSEAQGCHFCNENYHRKRIFRPIKLKELTDVIKNFEQQSCTYMHKFNNILDLLHKIIEEYNHFSYDEVKKVIYPKEGVSESSLMDEILEITTLLQEKSIKFQVDEHYNINLFIR
jgi:response regulator RpfG family c-di-GMP phosphodiesterase